MIDYGRYRYKLAISNLPKKNSKMGIIIYALLINIGPIMHSLADIWQKPFFIICDRLKQFLPKLSHIDPMLINNAYIIMPIAQLLSPKRSLYDFYSPSYIKIQFSASLKKGRGRYLREIFEFFLGKLEFANLYLYLP